MIKKYLNRIDAVRGLAILMVLFYHTLLGFNPYFEVSNYSDNGLIEVKGLKSFLLNFNPIGQGWIGVDLFLVISGFLIHFIYLQNQKEFTWADFYSKRFWRIYPPYVLVLFFLVINRPNFSNEGLTSLFSHLFLVHNLYDKTFFSINPSFWSIALESQLYLIYPLYLFLVRYFKALNTTIILFFISIGLNLIAFIFGIHSISFHNLVFEFWFTWSAGAFLAEKFYNNQLLFKKPFFWFIFFYTLFFVFKLFYFTSLFMLIPATLSCIALMETIMYSKLIDKFAITRNVFKVLSFIGLISYSLYLIHQPFIHNLLNFYNPNTHFLYWDYTVRIVFTYITLFAVSYFLYVFIEQKSIETGKNFRKK